LWIRHMMCIVISCCTTKFSSEWDIKQQTHFLNVLQKHLFTQTIGEAGCPCVRASIGMSFHSTLKSFNLEVKVISEGMYTFSKASCRKRNCCIINLEKSIQNDELFVLR
jgi:hypothetical protein